MCDNKDENKVLVFSVCLFLCICASVGDVGGVNEWWLREDAEAEFYHESDQYDARSILQSITWNYINICHGEKDIKRW